MRSLLTVKEVAERLRLSQSLVYALIAKGRIRHERYGLKRGIIRIPEDAVEQFSKTCEVDRLCLVPDDEEFRHSKP